MSRRDHDRGDRRDHRRRDRPDHRLPQRPGVRRGAAGRCRPDRVRGPCRRLRAGRHATSSRASSGRASRAGSPSTASRSSSTTPTRTPAGRRSRGPTTSTSRCSSCRCATTESIDRRRSPCPSSGSTGFDADDLRVLTILADRAATAVGSARLLIRTQDLARELRRLLDMSAELSGSLDPRQVADLMADHLATRDGRRRMHHQLLGPAGRAWSIRSATTRPTASPTSRRPRGRELPGDAARPRGPGRR